MKNIAVIGAGIVGICSAYFLKKSGFNVTLIDREQPGSITSFGHACTFADYANVPVNYPGLIWDIPSMLLRTPLISAVQKQERLKEILVNSISLLCGFLCEGIVLQHHYLVLSYFENQIHYLII